jgi:hypothetical protein
MAQFYSFEAQTTSTFKELNMQEVPSGAEQRGNGTMVEL